VPRTYKGRTIWLNFDGINYSATVWVNGTRAGVIRGAFIRGVFDVTSSVRAGKKAVIAVLISPQPNPGTPHEHTLRAGMGLNGGVTALDGPTFLSTIGWDWLPAIRDRDTGIWQGVSLSASGPVVINDPQVTTDLPLPKTDSADVAVAATVENLSNLPVKGTVEGTIGGTNGGTTENNVGGAEEPIHFSQAITLAPHASRLIHFDPKTISALRIAGPRLWWPNGYGAQPLYHLHLAFTADRTLSDSADVDFGIRKITYSAPGTDTLTISVNGVPIFIRGGDWGLDEGLKRIPRDRLEAEIRLHQRAHLNLIRNWVGQSTGEDFYELCDQYGILLWDEFFQPNPGDGPNPADIDTYIANVRDKVLRFRNHPSIAIWCARNEGDPPPAIDIALRKILADLDPTRRYQPSSTDGGGVRSTGPYNWRFPRDFYTITDDFFKTESGSVSIPTLESIHGMMPQKDWEIINDDWAEHDFARGASGAQEYPAVLSARYGPIRNLPDFVRKAQLANYEAFRAMYEGRNAQLFHPATALITWMSNPAQPSFVWQLYHYDLEPMSSYFAVMHAAELVHIQMNEATGHLQVINNSPEPVDGAVARVTVYNLDGSNAYGYETRLTATPEAATDLGPIDFPATLSAVHFVRLELRDPKNGLLSSNFYWRPQPVQSASAASGELEVHLAGPYDDLSALNQLPMVALHAAVDRKNQHQLSLTFDNPTASLALMAHVQLRRKTGERILPVYYSDNYFSLAPKEKQTIVIEVPQEDLSKEQLSIAVDGWNVTVTPLTSTGVTIAPNLDAQPGLWPETDLLFAVTGLR
jgi:hypothetical protein